MQHQHIDRPHMRRLAAIAVIGRRPLANVETAHAGFPKASLAPSCCRTGIIIATVLAPTHAKDAVRPTEARRYVRASRAGDRAAADPWRKSGRRRPAGGLVRGGQQCTGRPWHSDSY
jgi:hypothetical protein